jgi:hypothetical protein
MTSCAETAHQAKPATRYVRQPRTGDTIDTGRYGECEVVTPYRYGLHLLVRDRLGREWTVQRAPQGWWLRVRKAGAK